MGSNFFYLLTYVVLIVTFFYFCKLIINVTYFVHIDSTCQFQFKFLFCSIIMLYLLKLKKSRIFVNRAIFCIWQVIVHEPSHRLI
ncbi:hypothetical protein AQUCO_03600105v1 [Aquilegia coerulea]|uniref:Uncharacterized protein n=1 Tax=Aquilegia coerulea TaxID=218851 RepID=A0A2G5CVJ1_AQUCA|nr:hypothetical protein AQUCO_03600105v1 [Aquilegia coerulea]